MNSYEIETILTRSPLTHHLFGGVFPADHIPNYFDKLPKGLIVNTEPSTKGGAHWVAFYIPEIGTNGRNEKTLEFFDPLAGGTCEPMTEIRRWITRKTDDGYKLQRNISQVQSSNLGTCGPFCIYYIAQRANGQTMPEIMYKLTKLGMYKASTHVNNVVKKL